VCRYAQPSPNQLANQLAVSGSFFQWFGGWESSKKEHGGLFFNFCFLAVVGRKEAQARFQKREVRANVDGPGLGKEQVWRGLVGDCTLFGIYLEDSVTEGVACFP
jgi:hypothetical protein